MIGLLGYPFRGGYWYLRGYLADRDCRIAGIQEEPEGQIDVLNVGDSLADIAITPVEMYRDYGITSYVMGRDLVEAGIRPGPEMGRALAHAHRLRLAGADKAEQLRGTLAWIDGEGKGDA
jgi:hypothetical protein